MYLGNFAEMDTDDTTLTVEQSSILVGLTVTPQIVEVTEVNGGGDTLIHIDNYSTVDDFQYDLGSGLVDTDLDSSSRYSLDVLMGDGSVVNQNVTLLQFTNGDVFSLSSGGIYDDANIQTITINSHVADYAGYQTTGDPFASNTAVVCFAGNARILTPKGEVFAKDLAVGDMIETLSGPKQIRWMNTQSLDQPGQQAPIIFKPGSLGDGVPSRALRVSPQHRVLIETDQYNEGNGHQSVLVSAKSLLPAFGVQQDCPNTAVSYVHFALDSHEIVFANRTPVESFWPGKQALLSLSTVPLRRLVTSAPKLFTCFESNQTAALIIEGQSRKKMISRIILNDRFRCRQFVDRKVVA